jgi:hypothetical protein
VVFCIGVILKGMSNHGLLLYGAHWVEDSLVLFFVYGCTGDFSRLARCWLYRALMPS